MPPRSNPEHENTALLKTQSENQAKEPEINTLKTCNQLQDYLIKGFSPPSVSTQSGKALSGTSAPRNCIRAAQTVPAR